MVKTKERYKYSLICIIATIFLTTCSFILFYFLLSGGGMYIHDYQMKNIIMGVYGHADSHIVYSNTILGALFKTLYRLNDDIKWWEIVQLSTSFISLNIITYFVIKNMKSKISWCFVILINIVFGMNLFHYIRYENTAIVLCAAGIVINLCSSKELNSKKRMIGFIIAIFFILISALYSFAACIIGLGFSVIDVIINIINISKFEIKKSEKIKKIINTLLRLSTFIFIACCVYFISYASYHNNKEWATWNDYFYTYKTLYDNVETQKINYNDAREVLNWSENDWQVFKIGIFDDYNFFTKYSMAKLNEKASDKFKIDIVACFNVITENSFGVVALIFLIVSFFVINRKDVLKISYILLFSISVVIFAEIFKEMLKMASLNNVVYCGILIELLLFLTEKSNTDGLFTQVNNTQIIFSCVISILLGIHMYMENYTLPIKNEEQQIYKLMEYMEKNEDKIYFIDISKNERMYSSYNIQIPENVKMLGSGLKNLPICYTYKDADYDGNNFELLLEDDVYFVTEDGLMPFVYYNYYFEHYDNVDVYCDFKIGKYQVIRFFINE